MRFSTSVLPLAVAGGALANPLFERGSCGTDSCGAAVSGGSVECAAFLQTTVYPVETTTTTVAGVCTTTSADPGPCKPSAWKRDLSICPGEIPTTASACTNFAAYSSACSCYGYTAAEPTTTTTTTKTKTFWSAPTGWTTNEGGWVAPTDPISTSTGSWTGTWSGAYSTCTASTTTVYSLSGSKYTCAPITATATSTDTVTSTVTTTSATPTTCLTDDDATTLVNDFINFLEFTGANFDTALANSVLAADFTDTSDSINFLAGIPLTTVTFNSTAAFIGGQGNQAPIPSVVTLNIWHDCHIISWRWRATGIGNGALPVTGINVMVINDQKQIETNYSEFDNGAWLVDLGNPECSASTTATSKVRRSEQYYRRASY